MTNYPETAALDIVVKSRDTTSRDVISVLVKCRLNSKYMYDDKMARQTDVDKFIAKRD